MKPGYLLDSQVLQWFITGSDELGKGTRKLLMNEPNLHFTAISIAEFRIKEMLGKVKLQPQLTSALQNEGLVPLPYFNHHADEISRFGSLVGHDPFDRMILAQASAERLNLVTADRKLIGLGLSWLIDART